MDYTAYWDDVVAQRRERLAEWFAPGAVIEWPCTNERFTADEFVRVNCDYPGEWEGTVERVIGLPRGAVTVARVRSSDGAVSCHVTSFFTLRDDRIAALTEYYADDGVPPAWRADMRIGRPIR